MSNLPLIYKSPRRSNVFIYVSQDYDALDILDTLTAQAEAESTQYEEVRQQQRRQQEEEARQDSRGRTSPTLQLLHHQPLSQRDVLRDTAKTLNNLAAVLHQLRKFDEAMAVSMVFPSWNHCYH
jgi:hypothetical protein